MATPVSAAPRVDPELDAVFADAEEIHFSTPVDALPAVPAWPARAEDDASFEAHSDLVMDPFAAAESVPRATRRPDRAGSAAGAGRRIGRVLEAGAARGTVRYRDDG